MPEARRTIVYIDGFNFYYRCLKGSSYKRLNVVALCHDVLSQTNRVVDVNLATHLVRDAFREEFDVAVVISNDSDLYEPIRIVTHERGKPVGLLIPEGVVISAKLKPIASFIRPIRRTALARSQFADRLVDANGAFQKPSRW